MLVRLLRQEVKFGRKSALLPSAADMNANAESDFHESFLQAKTLQLAQSNEVVEIKNLVDDREDFGNRPKIVVRQLRKNHEQNLVETFGPSSQ